MQEGLQELPPTREQLEALRRERDEAKDALLRRRAEFDNFRKRSEREQQAAATEAAADASSGGSWKRSTTSSALSPRRRVRRTRCGTASS